jgi:crotonobetainyl-CoA:carnitine CoA-transferase CaiB-like acyl-CoA transferase
MAGEVGGAFAALNRDKRSIAINLKSSRGVEVARRLAARADVLIESFRPGVMNRLGLGFETLAADNPRLIYCAISGYGQEGPYRDRAGHDIDYAALAGVVALTGARGGVPVPPGIQVGDFSGALYGAIAILAALYERERSGKGRFLDVSMTEGALSFLTMLFGKVAAGFDRATRGEDELAGGLPCYGVYETSDGKAMALGALEPKFWLAFCEAVGRPDLAGKGHLQGAAGDAVRTQVAAIFRTRTRDEWISFFAGRDVCCEPVLEPAEVPHHPVHRARGSFLEVAGLSLLKTPGAAPGPHRPAPRLGEHTREVLSEAGCAHGEIESLLAEGVAATS